MRGFRRKHEGTTAWEGRVAWGYHSSSSHTICTLRWVAMLAIHLALTPDSLACVATVLLLVNKSGPGNVVRLCVVMMNPNRCGVTRYPNDLTS